MTIRQSVRDGFISFSTPLEGYTNWLYCDVKGLVTIGMGNLVDPSGLLAGLAFVRPDGSVASASEVSSAWLAVKNRQDLRLHGGGAYRPLTALRSTHDSIGRLIVSKLATVASILESAFPGLPAWPADAQLGILSMAWAMGAYFHKGWPRLSAACRNEDWATYEIVNGERILSPLCAAANCLMTEDGNSPLHPRNVANVVLFHNAAYAKDPDVLYYPQVLDEQTGLGKFLEPAEAPMSKPKNVPDIV